MDSDIKRAVEYIESRLSTMWMRGFCHPGKIRVFRPFSLIHRQNVRLVVLCKEPYDKSYLSTGIPIDTEGRLDTPSAKAFRDIISRYWDDVSYDKFMDLYYQSGILVLNSAFTKQREYDPKYSLTDSHYPLWTNFMVPFLRKLGSEGVPIVALGLEAKLLVRETVPLNLVYTSPFPTDRSGKDTFESIMRHAIEKYVFDVDKFIPSDAKARDI
jgi:uracil DNA glycosylase